MHAYNEKMALADYWYLQRMSVGFGTVCHFINFMVYREE